MAVKPLDPRAKQILFDEYWTPKGWRDHGSMSDRARHDRHDTHASAEELAYAKSAGFMFDPLTIGHDVVARARCAAAAAGNESAAPKRRARLA